MCAGNISFSDFIMILPIFIKRCSPIIIIKNFVVIFYCLLLSFTYLSISTNEKKTLNEATNWPGSFLFCCSFFRSRNHICFISQIRTTFSKTNARVQSTKQKNRYRKACEFRVQQLVSSC